MPSFSRFVVASSLALALALTLGGCGGSGAGSGGGGGGSLVTPTINWATPAAVHVGTALSATQLDAAAVVPGTTTSITGVYTYTPAAGTVMSTAGAQTLSVSFAPANSTQYASATASVTLTVTPNTPSYTWKNVQIVGGGYVTGIVMHPAQQGLMYARTDVGGAYRWNSTTSQWVPLTDWITRANSNLTGIESVAVDPTDPNQVYLAAGMYAESWGSNGAMLISSNQGASFTQVNLPIKLGSNDNGRNAGERLQVDPNLNTTLYFGSRNNGLWVSTNKAQSWSQVTSFPVTSATSGAGVVFETFVKSSSSAGSATKTIYAGVSATGTGTDPQSLYVSTNAGATWSAVPGAPTGLYVTHGVLGPDGNLYLTYGDQVGPGGLTTGQVWQYVLPSLAHPAGVWNNITPPRGSGYQGGYGAVTLDPEMPGVIMVSTLDHYYPVGDDIWRSINYGQVWYSIDYQGATRNTSLSPWLNFGSSSITGTGNWVGAMQIDPFDSKHVVYGTGGTVMTTDDITTSDAGNPSQWSVGALGIEETVTTGLISPPSGPANLLSVAGDLGGFQFTTLAASPAAGNFSNPGFSTGTGIDFAQSSPSIMARVGYGSNSQFGGYSTNSGTSWTPFASNPSASIVNGAGSVAVSADGSTIVWAPSDTGVATYTTANNGTNWTLSTGAPAQQPVIADRIAAKTFYVFNPSSGSVLTSTNGGVTFTTTQTGLPNNGTLYAAYDATGDLYLTTGSGLYHSTGGGAFTAMNGIQAAWAIGFGMAAPGSSTLTIFLAGEVGGVSGLFRSTNGGSSWVEIDDAAHQYGYYNIVVGDPRIFARVYLGTGGRGIVYGDSPY